MSAVVLAMGGGRGGITKFAQCGKSLGPALSTDILNKCNVDLNQTTRSGRVLATKPSA